MSKKKLGQDESLNGHVGSAINSLVVGFKYLLTLPSSLSHSGVESRVRHTNGDRVRERERRVYRKSLIQNLQMYSFWFNVILFLPKHHVLETINFQDSKEIYLFSHPTK